MYNKQLETFIKVADSKSFSMAAEELFVSPTAVMKQINLLESDLNLQLFERTHRGISLTEAGKSLYKDAKYIVQYSNDSLTRAKNAMYSDENIIRIGTSPITPSQFLLEIWPKIHAGRHNFKFQLVPFDNTPENAREILKNLGQNIDVVAGIFDTDTLRSRGCAGLELSKEPVCCAVSIHHKLASKSKLTYEDFYGENLMLIQRGWNSYVDVLRDDVLQNHQGINVIDFPFYNTSVFNQCENSNDILISISQWENVHPLLKIIPVQWEHVVPFGLLYSPEPSKQVQEFIHAVAQVFDLEV